MRYNQKVTNSYVVYAECNDVRKHKQKFRCEIGNLDEALAQLRVTSDNKLQNRHKEGTARYRQIRGRERDKLKKILKYRKPMDLYSEKIVAINKELWHDGQLQDSARLTTFQKIKSEVNLQNRLKLESLDLQDIMQLCIEEKKRSDPYVQLTALDFLVLLYTKEQQRVIKQEPELRIAHSDSTGSMVRRPGGLKCSKIMYYAIVCKLFDHILRAAEMYTSKVDVCTISTFYKYYKNFIIKNKFGWPFFNPPTHTFH